MVVVVNFQDIQFNRFEVNDENRREIADHELALQEKEREAVEERTERALKRVASHGRMTALERIESVVDRYEDDAPRLWHIGAMRSYEGNANASKALGVLCVLGVVAGRSVVIIANDNTQSAGAWWPGTPEKIQAAQNMALRLRIPVIYFVECAGLYLACQEKTYAGAHGAGAIFERQAQLNRSGIVQLAAVFGDCIAGGGYMPILCDKIVMTEQSSICIGGSAISSAACGRQADRIGGPDVHVVYSHTADARVADDGAAIAWIRREVEKLPTPATAYYRIADSVLPQAPIADLYDILPTDLSHPYNIEDVVARIVDASQCVPLCHEFGEEIYSCFATVDGLPVVIIANRAQTIESDGRLKSGGILYKEGIVKIRRIASAANDDGIPTIWIQDVAGFDIGAQAERDGLLRLGAGILHEIASDERDTPAAMTIVLRKASGAGYYAMKGSPFHPAWTVVTAITRMEVMRSDVLASALYDKKISKIDGEIKARQIKDGLALDCAEIAQLARNRDELVEARTALASAQNDNAQPRAALARGDADSFVALSQLRRAIVDFLHAAWQEQRIVRPKRLWGIWSL